MCLKLINPKPVIREASPFLTSEECADIIRFGDAFLKPSLVTDRASGTELDPGRTSYSGYLPSGGADNSVPQAIRVAEELAVLLCGVPLERLETLQIVRYEEDQQYKPHYDFFEDYPEKNNQRTHTIFVYLNTLADTDPHVGGETYFPNVDIRIRPVTGKAVVWENCAPGPNEPSCDVNTLHAGLPVRGGVKYGLNIWARAGNAR